MPEVKVPHPDRNDGFHFFDTENMSQTAIHTVSGDMYRKSKMSSWQRTANLRGWKGKAEYDSKGNPVLALRIPGETRRSARLALHPDSFPAAQTAAEIVNKLEKKK